MPDALRAVIISAKIVLYGIKYCFKAALWIFTLGQKFGKRKSNATEE